MALGSDKIIVPEEIAQKVKAYDMGLLCLWAPQQRVLEHPVSYRMHLTRLIISLTASTFRSPGGS